MAVSGTAGGWDLAQVLQMAGVDMEADGQIGREFNLTGRNDTVSEFVASMQGPVNLSLTNGMIATSLLELAGLGVIPWLFSEERRTGRTSITCLKAPLRIRAGRISFDPVVAETGSVQVVAKGEIDARKESISVRAEPRPLGRPLARSAWPVDITGSLNSPDVKVQVGGSRQRRADGADATPQSRQPCVADVYQLENR